ncbi:MAG: AAA family ATPase [Acidobacteriota bacterium]
MQRHDPAPTTSRRAVVVSPDRNMVAELEPILLQKLGGVALSHAEYYPAPRDAATHIGSAISQIIFLDVTSDADKAFALLPELGRLPGTQILALLGGNHPDAILRCLRAGAADFLLRPFTSDQLEGALSKVARFNPVSDPGIQGGAKVIAVMPAKGACGATTLAVNLAFQFRKIGAKRVLLADLDPLAGTVSFLLKLKSTFSFLEVLQRGNELDQDLWKSTVNTVGGIDVLLSPDLALTGMPQQIDASPIVNFARNSYDVVILDAGSVYGEWNLSQARSATEVLLVTTNELPALQAAQRALTYLETGKISKSKTRLIVNRYQRDIGLSREVIGTALHTEVFETLPSDYDSVQKALMEGKSVLPSTAFGKGVAQLAEHLGGFQEKAGKPAVQGGGISGLFGGLFSKTKK